MAASAVPLPPGSTRVSIRSALSGSGEVPSTRPLSVRTGATADGGEGHAVAAGSPDRGSRPARAGEDLVRADGIERLDAFEGDDDDVALLHGSHSAVRDAWRQ